MNVTLPIIRMRIQETDLILPGFFKLLWFGHRYMCVSVCVSLCVFAPVVINN